MTTLKHLILKSLFYRLTHKSLSAWLLRGERRRYYPVDSGHELIRLGPASDGGYLVPADLDGIEACFSPGVDVKSEFELLCAEMGMKVFLADASVDTPAESHENFHFTKKFIGKQTEGDFITMQKWISQSPISASGDLLLQMDIEGWEFDALESMDEKLIKRFRVIVIEVHGLLHLTPRKIKALRKLTKHHSCVHSHPNNCEPPEQVLGIEIPPYLEFTFLRKDRFKDSQFREDFPHVLDMDCTNQPHFPLPEGWYSQER